MRIRNALTLGVAALALAGFITAPALAGNCCGGKAKAEASTQDCCKEKASKSEDAKETAKAGEGTAETPAAPEKKADASEPTK